MSCYKFDILFEDLYYNFEFFKLLYGNLLTRMQGNPLDYQFQFSQILINACSSYINSNGYKHHTVIVGYSLINN